MNHINSGESIPTLDNILNEMDDDEKESIRLSERRNAIKPYIPPPKNEINNYVKVKESKRYFFSCCRII